MSSTSKQEQSCTTKQERYKEWASRSSDDRKKEYYYWHIQMARDLTEVAEEMEVELSVLVGFAEQEGLPILDYGSEMAPRQRHALALHESGRGPLVEKNIVPVKRPPRPPRETVFMEVAKVVAQRSTCLSDQNGAVIVLDKRVVATGYNGAPAGKYHCIDIGICKKELFGFQHFDESIPGQVGAAYEVSRSVHAEQSCICACAKYGIAICGADIYVTREPCVICLRMIINSGIKKVYYLDREDKERVHAMDPMERMI